MKISFIRKEAHERAIFRIIPHQSVLNQQNRKFMVAIHELLTVKTKRWRINLKDDFYIAFRPNPDIWYVVKMAAEVETKRIEFYFSVPKDYADAFKIKFQSHEQWRRCTIEEVESFDFPDSEDTDVYKLKYKRHDIFSLRADHSEQTTPIRDLLTISDELQDGEFIDLFFRCEAVDRGKWRKIADYAWETWEKGRVPVRPGIDPIRFARNAFSLLGYVLVEFVSILQDGWQALQNQFFKREEGVKREKIKITDPERAAILVNGKLSTRTSEKRVRPVFKVLGRIVIHAENPVRRGMLSKSVGAAYDPLAEDNSLHMVKVNFGTKKALNDLKEWRIFDPEPMKMSVDELAKIEQLPTGSVQDEFLDALESNQKVEVEIPECFLDESGIFVGAATDRGETHNIHIPAKNLDKTMTARGFVGSPRQGKDQALINLIVESKRKHGIGSVIPDWIDERNKDKDGHWRGISNAVRDALPAEDIIDIDCTNYEWAVYFGLHNVMASFENSRIAADEVSKIITDFLMGKESGDLHTTREYLRDAAKVCSGDWVDIKRLFTDPDFRQMKIDEMEKTNIGDPDLWNTFHEDLSDAQRASIFTPINVRLGEIMNDEVLKPILCQLPNPKADLIKWIREGKVIILRMKFNPMTAKIFAHFVVMMVYLIKRQLDGEGSPTWLILNEPHQVETPSFTEFLNRILVEGPKYRLAPILAFHHLGRGHLSPALIDTLSSANISWHMFYNSNVQTYEKLREHIEPTFTPETAMQSTAQFHFVAAGWRDHEGLVQIPFMVKAPERVKDRWGFEDNEKITHEHSRKYGRSIEEVLTDFRQRSRIKKKPKEESQAPLAAGNESIPVPEPKKPPKHVYMKK